MFSLTLEKKVFGHTLATVVGSWSVFVWPADQTNGLLRIFRVLLVYGEKHIRCIKAVITIGLSCPWGIWLVLPAAVVELSHVFGYAHHKRSDLCQRASSFCEVTT